MSSGQHRSHQHSRSPRVLHRKTVMLQVVSARIKSANWDGVRKDRLQDVVVSVFAVLIWEAVMPWVARDCMDFVKLVTGEVVRARQSEWCRHCCMIMYA